MLQGHYWWCNWMIRWLVRSGWWCAIPEWQGEKWQKNGRELKLGDQLGINLDANTCREVAGVFVGKFFGVFFLSLISFFVESWVYVVFFWNWRRMNGPVRLPNTKWVWRYDWTSKTYHPNAKPHRRNTTGIYFLIPPSQMLFRFGAMEDDFPISKMIFSYFQHVNIQRNKTGWWFQTFFDPMFGEMIQFD